MSSTLQKLRNKQRIAFNNKFNEISNSSSFKKAQTDLSLNGYRFQVISAQYVPQIIDTICYGYSVLGNGPIGTIFQLTVFDRYQEWGAAKVNHWLKTGLMLIVVDKKTNLVAGTAGYFDLMDQYKNQHSHQLPLKIKHKKECSAHPLQMASKENEELNKIHNNEINEDDLHLYFGKWIEGSGFTVRPDIKKTGLGFLLIFISAVISIQIGYRYVFSRVTNPRSLLFFQTGPGYRYFAKFRLYDLVFNDGTKMKKYFDELRTKWGYNQNQIERLKKIHLYSSIVELPRTVKIDRINELLKLRFFNRIRKSNKSKL